MHFKFEFQKIDLVQWFKYKKNPNKLFANTNMFKSFLFLMTMVYSYLKPLIQCLFLSFFEKVQCGTLQVSHCNLLFKILAMVSQSGSVGHTVIQKMNLHKEGDIKRPLLKNSTVFWVSHPSALMASVSKATRHRHIHDMGYKEWVIFLMSSQFWTSDVSQLRTKRTALLLSTPLSFFQILLNSTFHL